MQDEYDKWLEHHGKVNPSDFQKQKIAEDTGRVPMYLSRMIKYFDEHGNIQLAIEQCAKSLGRECEKALNNFYSENHDDHQNRIACAKELLREVEPSYLPEYMDHQYFYIEKEQSHAVCGIARATLAIILRAISKTQADAYFLSDEYVQACLRSNNPSVKGFQAEQIAISAINRNGFHLCEKVHRDIATSFFQTSKTAVLTGEPCCHYIPKPFNYKFIDSLVRVVKFKKNSSVEKSADIYAIQYTLQQYERHKGSLDFFNEEFQPWEGKIEKKMIKWHFVWILTNDEAKTQRSKNPSLHGKSKRHKKAPLWYTEWFYSFQEIADALKI